MAYECDGCEKYLCIEHVYRIADWDKNYCKEYMDKIISYWKSIYITNPLY